jgi:hypothetical protein
VLTLLTGDAWLTMPPEPYEYQGLAAIAGFLRHRAALRGAPLRLVPTRANTQPAFGCYLPCAQTPIARPYGIIVLTLRGDQISAITWFSDSSVFPTSGPAPCPTSTQAQADENRTAAGCASPPQPVPEQPRGLYVRCLRP